MLDGKLGRGLVTSMCSEIIFFIKKEKGHLGEFLFLLYLLRLMGGFFFGVVVVCRNGRVGCA